ncbi:MAG: hypothetical protein NHB15_06395 [Methanosarcina barkeri]|nr:hypothetical protein [Methanosarcina sp. ERenArc_MAG2]
MIKFELMAVDNTDFSNLASYNGCVSSSGAPGCEKACRYVDSGKIIRRGDFPDENYSFPGKIALCLLTAENNLPYSNPT